MPTLAYLWPGLPHLWVEGSWAGLALAIGFTVLFNLAVVNLVVWPEMLQAEAKWVGGVALAGLWLAALVETRGELRRQAERRRAEAENRPDPEAERQKKLAEECDRQLIAAQRLYLAGDWGGAERILLPLAKNNKHDIEAQLLLATVWRRQGRTKEAAKRLRWLMRLEASGPWRFGLENELRIANSLDHSPVADDHQANTHIKPSVETDQPADAA